MTQFLALFSARQFMDLNGIPYAGAKLFTYQAGTSTKVTTTKDEAGASNHTNPIILNTRGEPADAGGASQAIWYTAGSKLKFVLAPSTDTDPPLSPISTWDNINGPVNASTFMETVLDDANSNTVLTTLTATRSEAGAVAVPVLTKLREVVSVKDFGTVGDGVTNDATAIQAALDSGAGEVFFPKGTYQVNTMLTVPVDTKVTGVGVRSIIRPGASMSAVLKIIGGNNSSVEKLQIVNQSGYATAGVLIAEGLSKVSDNYIVGFPRGVSIDGGDNLTIQIDGNTILSCDFGIICVEDGRNSLILNNHIQGGTGIWFGYTTTQPEGVRIINNNILPNVTAEPNSGHGIAITGGLEYELRGNVVDNIDKYGVYLPNTANTNYIKIVDNWFGCDAAVPGSSGIYTLGAVSHVTAIGNTITGAANFGMNVDYTAGGQPNSFSITDNHFYGNAGGDLRIDNLLTSVIRGNHFNSSSISTVEQDNNSTCLFSENAYTLAPSAVSTGSTYKHNLGYVTSKGGVTGAIATGATITHGLAAAPTIVTVTAGQVGPTDIYVTAAGATTFTVNFGGGGSYVLYWEAKTARHYG